MNETLHHQSSKSAGKHNQNPTVIGFGLRKPLPTDIVFGRGGLACHHIGNIRYRETVESYKPAYLNAKARKEKIKIKRKCMRKLQKKQFRFVQQATDGLWYKVPDKKALKKIVQALREGKSKMEEPCWQE